MTQNQVINKLALELAFKTGRMEDMKVYKEYIRMALVVGTEHFTVKTREIVAMDREGRELGRFKSVREASKKTDANSRDIYKVLERLRPTVRGMKFVYADDVELIKRPKPEPANDRAYSGYREHQL